MTPLAFTRSTQGKGQTCPCHLPAPILPKPPSCSSFLPRDPSQGLSRVCKQTVGAFGTTGVITICRNKSIHWSRSGKDSSLSIHNPFLEFNHVWGCLRLLACSAGPSIRSAEVVASGSRVAGGAQHLSPSRPHLLLLLPCPGFRKKKPERKRNKEESGGLEQRSPDFSV